MPIDLWAEISDAASQAGLDAIGACGVEPLEPARSVLGPRKARGLASTMQFTYRNPARSTDPAHTLEGARSIVVAALGYGSSPAAAPSFPSGRVAQYAWSDHYGRLADALGEVVDVLHANDHRTRIHLDDNHLVDRNVAHRAGLGWYGKNANLLLPDAGSWFVLGSIVTDAELTPTGPPLADGCGPCTHCFSACPTDAIVAPGVIDADRCIAWLVQGPGDIPEHLRAAIGDRLYGCDDCQTACPPNAQRVDLAEPPDDADPWVELQWLLTATDDELMGRVGRWYIADRDPDIVRRTGLVVLGNSGRGDDPAVVDLLRRHLACDRPMLVRHAQWAATALGRSDLIEPAELGSADIDSASGHGAS